MLNKNTVYPRKIDTLLTNPGIGFIAAPTLMDDKKVITDNRGKVVNKYKFTLDSRTWNHPDSNVYYCGVRWKDIEEEQGKYKWEILEEKLEYAKKLGCTAIVRCSPYALSEEEDIPK